MKPHLIMPMGGAGSRFFENGYIQPKPLMEINNKPFFYWAAMSVKKYIDVEDLTFVVLQNHINEFEIDKKIRFFFPDAIIIVIPEILQGPVFTSLRGVQDINDEAPIIFNDCDHIFKCTLLNESFGTDSFAMDGALLAFESNEPQFSYIKYENERIIGTVEKKVVSNHAICGAYVFRSTQVFRRMAEIYTGTCPYKECFMSGIYNVMCEKGMTIIDYMLDYHVEFGTPEEYEKAKNSKYFHELC